MANKLKYDVVVDKTLDHLKKINDLAKEFSKFEMTEGVEDEIKEVLELSDIGEISLSGDKKKQFYTLMENAIQIEDNLEEISMITGNLIKDVNEMSDKAREVFYGLMGIKKIEKEDQGLSEQRVNLILDMLELVRKITDKFFDYTT